MILALGLAAAARAGDLAPLVRDTQITRSENGNVQIVWWIPDEFWETSFKDHPAVPAESQKEVLKLVRPYVVVAIVEGRIGPLGGFEGLPREKMLAKTWLKFGDKAYTPIPDDDLDQASKLFSRP